MGLSPHEVVKASQFVKVKVLDVDVKRQRIAQQREPQAMGAMAQTLAKLTK